LALAVIATVAATATMITTDAASAWKPYTHIVAADTAYQDAVGDPNVTGDGAVTINGVEYPINQRLEQALQEKKASYDAGVVGPDAYPDTIMGQAIIHPKNTGKWLDHLLEKAWDAQNDPDYGESDKLEILAFSYGFLTHAAGDMWAHTLVNDFAQGVFPEVGDLAGDPEAAAIALRHIIIEGYIGDATPGFDGNENRTPVPGETNESGQPQVSDDATRGITYDAPPDRFLYEVFVGRASDANGLLTQPLPGQPTAKRGPIIDFFYNLRNDLAPLAGTNSNLQEAVDDLTELVEDIAAALEECAIPFNPLCLPALLELGFASLEALFEGTASLLAAPVEAVVDAYFAAWVEDIDYGLQHWGNIGQAFAEGLFDPHARRVHQDEKCHQESSGAEDDAARVACENDVGVVSTFTDAIGDSFLTDDPRLLSMLGVPDVAIDVVDAVNAITDALDELIDFQIPVVEDAIAELEAFLIDELVVPAISNLVGVPVDVFAEVLSNPSAWLDGPGTPVDLPAPLDVFNDVGLFVTGEHERLDEIIGFDEPGLTDEHHNLENRRLDDVAEFVVEEFAPLENTITTAKLVLLDGDQLNHVLTDTVGRDVGTYPAGERTNVMIDALNGGEPWLESIDSDHAWRQDGLPRFCDPGSPLCAVHGATPRIDSGPNGGNGRMPIWESCVTRPAFRSLFTDWENGVEQFPDLDDGVSSDPGSDPNAPTSSVTLDPGSASFHDPVTNRDFVGGDNQFTLDAVDTPTGKAFPRADLEVQYRVTDPNGVVGPWITAVPGDSFNLTGPDGRYLIETQAADPCHTFAGGDDMEPEAIQSVEVFLDTTAPTCTCDNPPFGSTFDSDDFATVAYEVDDGPAGSGVASFSSIIDGFLTSQEATTPINDGDPIDMYLFYPGLRTVTVTATDNIGNTGDSGCTFTLSPTSVSLTNNLNRARAEGDVPSTGVFKSLTASLNVAVAKHDTGQHSVEANSLDAFAEEIEGQIGGGTSGSGIDTVVGNRFIAYANDIIARAA
jgi:hypothetical protein